VGCHRQVHGGAGDRWSERHGAQRLLPGTGPVPRAGRAWRQASQDANEKPVLTLKEQKELERLRAQDQREIKRLKQELRRKEKALAAAEALLIASKKIQAIWGEDGDD